MKYIEELFMKANLTEEEKIYFIEDSKNAEILGYTNIKDYYNSKETQYCIVEYASEKYKQIAQNGLNKILKTFN